jgi:hypothetical protein
MMPLKMNITSCFTFSVRNTEGIRSCSVDVLNVFPYFSQLSISDQLQLLLSESIIMPRVEKLGSFNCRTRINLL